MKTVQTQFKRGRTCQLIKDHSVNFTYRDLTQVPISHEIYETSFGEFHKGGGVNKAHFVTQPNLLITPYN